MKPKCPIQNTNHLIRRFISNATQPDSISAVQIEIQRLVTDGKNDQALGLYARELHPLGSHANSFVIPTAIKASCSSPRSNQVGIQLHSFVLKTGSDSDPVVSNALVYMYSKWACPELARKVFDTMPCRDTVSWNSIVNCYLQNGSLERALEMFKEMYSSGIVPKGELVAGMVSLCDRRGQQRVGRVVHGLVVVDERIEESVFLLTSLVRNYFECGESDVALKVFHRAEVKNEVLWTAMVSGFAANSGYEMALECFRRMQDEGCKPNRVTLIAVLPACAELGCVKHGKAVHGYAFRNALYLDCCFAASLIHMYSQCGEALNRVRLVSKMSKVKDVVLWSSVIGSYSHGGDNIGALKLFRQMLEDGIEPNFVTLLTIISACRSMTSVEHGCAVHACIVKLGCTLDVSVANALIDMYSKCGCIGASCQMFGEMRVKDLISWSTMISSYGLHGYGREALSLFLEMRKSKMKVDETTILAVLSACNHSGLVEEGRWMLDTTKGDSKLIVGPEHYTCLIDLLAKSGKIVDAFDILRTMPVKPTVKALSTLASACRTHGRLDDAQGLARQLIGLEPGNAGNYVQLITILAESGDWSGAEEVRGAMKLLGVGKSCGFSHIVDTTVPFTHNQR